jgi:hypothetical protein
MKKKTSVALFIGSQLLFATLSIHKHTLLTKLSYQKQSAQEGLKKLHAQKELVASKLCDVQNPKRVKQFAQEELGMQPLSLKKIKRLTVC